MESLWGLITIVGPIALAAVILWAILANRKRTRSEVDRTERGTAALRDQIDREDKQGSHRG